MRKINADKLTRRRILASAVFGLAGAWAHPGAAQSSRNDVVRVGIVGLQGRGRNLARMFEDIPGVETVAFCDVDPRVLDIAFREFRKKSQRTVQRHDDVRRLLDDTNIDVIVVATPNHWHALMGVWVMQASKDVFVEHPCSHNLNEGRKLIEAADRYGRITQHGTQLRSVDLHRTAIEFLRAGGIGKVHTAVAVSAPLGKPLRRFPDGAPPSGFDWDQWVGPARKTAFSQRYMQGQSKWYWEFGNGVFELAGCHNLDFARWALGKDVHPTHVHAVGGRFGFNDDGETPNMLTVAYDYGNARLQYEMRSWRSKGEPGLFSGVVCYGSKGYLVLNAARDRSWRSYLGPNATLGPSNTVAPNAPRDDWTGASHVANFITAVRSRVASSLTAPFEQAHLSSGLVHLGNIAYRTGRPLTFDPDTETFPGDDEANQYLTREYRAPFTMPAVV